MERDLWDHTATFQPYSNLRTAHSAASTGCQANFMPQIWNTIWNDKGDGKKQIWNDDLTAMERYETI